MNIRPFLTLTEVSFQLGIIGVSEYIERREIALWLRDENGSMSDPRSLHIQNEHQEIAEPDSAIKPAEAERTRNGGEYEAPSWQHFLFKKTWLFTRSDPDSYPSTPHGHLQRANRGWPKLNPYTGRAFKARHQEDSLLRLGKKEMRDLWEDETFRDFCRSYIVWYIETFPMHRFATRHPLRFPRR